VTSSSLVSTLWVIHNEKKSVWQLWPLYGYQKTQNFTSGDFKNINLPFFSNKTCRRCYTASFTYIQYLYGNLDTFLSETRGKFVKCGKIITWQCCKCIRPSGFFVNRLPPGPRLTL
jgi:hypothetical protein